MARAQRLEKMDLLREELEEEYREALINALRVTAAGNWGLFDHNQDRFQRASVAPMVEKLCDLGEEIDGLREKLGLEPFALHEKFEASRGPVPTTAVGEPKQAKAWLAKLAGTTA